MVYNALSLIGDLLIEGWDGIDFFATTSTRPRSLAAVFEMPAPRITKLHSFALLSCNCNLYFSYKKLALGRTIEGVFINIVVLTV